MAENARGRRRLDTLQPPPSSEKTTNPKSGRCRRCRQQKVTMVVARTPIFWPSLTVARPERDDLKMVATAASVGRRQKRRPGRVADRRSPVCPPPRISAICGQLDARRRRHSSSSATRRSRLAITMRNSHHLGVTRRLATTTSSSSCHSSQQSPPHKSPSISIRCITRSIDRRSLARLLSYHHHDGACEA